MQCPVCYQQAENLTPNTLDGVVVGCSNCGDYRISGAAYLDLSRLDRGQRHAALKVAKAGNRAGWPIISPSCIAGTVELNGPQTVLS